MNSFVPVKKHSAIPAEDLTARAEDKSAVQNEQPPVPQMAWSFRNAGTSAPAPVSISTLGASTIQHKLAVNAPGDRYEQEADRVAEQVMRMPETGGETAAPATGAAPAELQRKCAACEEEEKVQRKETGPAEAGFAPPVVHEALRSPGVPLDSSSRAYFEPRFGRDFSQVRVHSGDTAAESAKAVDALAYTVGNDVVFGAGQYRPQTSSGRRLLAHELAHTVQQAGPVAQKVQRTQTVTLTVKGRSPMSVVIGELRFTKEAIDDVLKAGALLPSADQAHIGFKGDQLGYDPAYTNPTDPYRWNKLKEIIDSDAKILVKKVDLAGAIKVLFITPKGRAVIDDNMRQLGLTLPTETLYKQLDPTATTMTVSPLADTHTVLYTTALGSPADSSMAHELFGHMWLALKGVPWQHPSDAAAIAARGTLSAQHGILDPFGNVYTGKVQDYIDRYVGSERGMLASPTQNVGPQLLQSALSDFQTSFSKGATGTMNGAWKVPGDSDTKWEIVSKNYVLAPQPPAPATSTQAPSTVPAPKTPAPQQGTTTNQPSAPAPSAPSITQSSIEQQLTKFYQSLDPDKQYVFIRFMMAIQHDFQRRSELATKMLNTLTKPKGMNPPIDFVP